MNFFFIVNKVMLFITYHSVTSLLDMFLTFSLIWINLQHLALVTESIEHFDLVNPV